MLPTIVKIFALSFCFAAPLNTWALLKLPALFTDNIVLQQKTNAGIWGSATPGKTVTIHTSWNNKKYYVTVDKSGNWKVKVPTPSYGGPYTIEIAEENKVELKNVLIGDVWLCSGQSNMEMPLAGWGKIMNYREEIAKANYPQIRLLQAAHVVSNSPKTEFVVRGNRWEICTPKTIAEFSSVAYFFARTVYEKTKIPIGLIHSSWGGTVAEAWTSYETLSTLGDFAHVADSIRRTNDANPSDYQRAFKDWFAALDKYDIGLADAITVWTKPSTPLLTWNTMQLPGPWEFKGLSDFDGGVWFRKKISLPEQWKKDGLLLNLGTVDEYDETYFNGEKIGETYGATNERQYKIPQHLIKEGENEIVIRIKDSKGFGGLRSDSDRVFIKSLLGDSINLSGNWFYKISFSLKDVPPAPLDPNHPNRPAVLYNTMINPLTGYAIKGVIWYQGESNSSRASQYRTLFPALIKDWRMKFSIPDMPFYFVQIASYRGKRALPSNSSWAELREAQLLTSKLPYTGMATILDIGDSIDVHPKNKQEVGRRLALIALHKTYGKKNEYSGPLLTSHEVIADKIVLTFDHAKGMRSKNGTLRGFAIAGEDLNFFWADGKITGNTITVISPNVKVPVAVRYAWADNPDANLINNDDLPASPFRIDTRKAVPE